MAKAAGGAGFTDRLVLLLRRQLQRPVGHSAPAAAFLRAAWLPVAPAATRLARGHIHGQVPRLVPPGRSRRQQAMLNLKFTGLAQNFNLAQQFDWKSLLEP
jgi:hypothetical protein